MGFLFYDLCPPVKPALCKAVPPGVYETARKRFRSIFISYPVRNKIMEAWAGKGVRNYQNNWGKRFKSKKKQYVKSADNSNGGALVTPADIDRSSKTVSY